jgi:hypothetical protein
VRRGRGSRASPRPSHARGAHLYSNATCSLSNLLLVLLCTVLVNLKRVLSSRSSVSGMGDSHLSKTQQSNTAERVQHAGGAGLCDDDPRLTDCGGRAVFVPPLSSSSAPSRPAHRPRARDQVTSMLSRPICVSGIHRAAELCDGPSRSRARQQQLCGQCEGKYSMRRGGEPQRPTGRVRESHRGRQWTQCPWSGALRGMLGCASVPFSTLSQMKLASWRLVLFPLPRTECPWSGSEVTIDSVSYKVNTVWPTR